MASLTHVLICHVAPCAHIYADPRWHLRLILFSMALFLAAAAQGFSPSPVHLAPQPTVAVRGPAPIMAEETYGRRAALLGLAAFVPAAAQATVRKGGSNPLPLALTPVLRWPTSSSNFLRIAQIIVGGRSDLACQQERPRCQQWPHE